MVRNIRYWIFDLDNTLYPPASGLFAAIDRRINQYLTEFCDFPAAEVDAVRLGYFNRYGLTLLGLMEERDTDPGHYLEFVHRVPLARYLRPNQMLRTILESIPVPKVIFTNGSRQHSTAVIEELGVSDLFEEIFDIASLGYIAKPDRRSYEAVLERLGISGAEAVMADDLKRNLPPARELGMTAVLVGRERPSAKADYTIAALEELPSVLAELHP